MKGLERNSGAGPYVYSVVGCASRRHKSRNRFREVRGNYLELGTRIRGLLWKSVDVINPFIRNTRGLNLSADKMQV